MKGEWSGNWKESVVEGVWRERGVKREWSWRKVCEGKREWSWRNVSGGGVEGKESGLGGK